MVHHGHQLQCRGHLFLLKEVERVIGYRTTIYEYQWEGLEPSRAKERLEQDRVQTTCVTKVSAGKSHWSAQ